MTKDTSSRLVPHRDLKRILAAVEKPGRYVGGEFGSIQTAPREGDFRVCIVFPDLYEIAMSNQAVRILYKLINEMPGFHAERAFSPAPDFREALNDAQIPLYSLETGSPVREFDLLAVTIGYELSFTNYLAFLESSGIPLFNIDRTDADPLILAGGPAMTNPAPWGEFIDGVFIGEAEGRLTETFARLKGAGTAGKGRAGSLEAIHAMDSIWTRGNPTADRALWPGFGRELGPPAAHPVPSLAPVQDHGVVEIMRGCPNKCRFCHAGVFYRPFRQKPMKRILDEVAYLVDECGYRDITLSSLSTGDYGGLEPLVESLNRLYADRKVSFSLPSLRVNSVTLTLIGSLGAVRKSGLTFAVETPTLAGQKGINKEVPGEKVAAILKEAKSQGWKAAKFYFMLGLPVSGDSSEEEAIADYLLTVQKETGMNLNVNLGTFIPKPHTPFERASQLTDEEAISRIRKIRDGLRGNKRIRFSFHSPYVSFLEGILSRGDERAGRLALEAWRYGAEFDAWDDRMDKDAWRRAIKEADWPVEQTICRRKEPDEALPWDGVRLGVTARHLAKEQSRSLSSELTVPCAVKCSDHCGVCDRECQPVISTPEELERMELSSGVHGGVGEQGNWKRLLIRFAKDGPAVYLGHLDVMNVFEKTLQRSGITIDFTQGFNPKPRIEFAQPLSLGISSQAEICTIRIRDDGRPIQSIREAITGALPAGFEIIDASWIGPAPEGKKNVKVMSAFWGSDWGLTRSMDTGGDLSGTELAQAIVRICAENGIPGDCAILSAEDQSIHLRLRHGGTRNHNLMRILETALERKPLSGSWSVARLESWAKSAEGEPVRFAEAFSA